MTKLPMSTIADILGGLARLAKKRSKLDPLEVLAVKNNFDLLLQIAELDDEIDVVLYLKDQIKQIEGVKTR